MRKVYRRVSRTAQGLVEEWVSVDDMSRERRDVARQLGRSIALDPVGCRDVPGHVQPEAIVHRAGEDERAARGIAKTRQRWSVRQRID